ncbi:MULTISPECIES: glycerophosphodiester phosphodiesterase [Bizionia]|uniref:Glycerophosphodiester phosphodiesterase n=1 Tax=Bizionia algoritergicola TaxID=291187 RepID=A0A5D0R1G8_9FLAO|nr:MULTISPECIES: glycerophosphodiester phosphodiesterase family protein [Bizionia]OBX23034.1 glycerophosphodiester phosphodiesterase [Bizionia sp. APA-3]TYB74691.1 glycerophosphodiester phosphodiesterase [Bizionia algoritergicola]
MQNASTRVFGHRGAKGYLAENTIESIEKALSFNVDGIEIDVHLCASGELVVFHDFTLDRMTNGTGEVGKQTLEALKNLTVNGGFQVPTLEDVLNLIDKKCILNIELKGKNTAIKTCEIVDDYVRNHGWKYADFIVSSFQHTELEAVFQTNKNIPIAVLTKASVTEAIELAETIEAKIIHPNYALLTRDNVKLAQNMGYMVNTWTVNDADTILRMKSYGVNGIISDVPDKI